MLPFHHSLMSSCSCQHLLIACNSSLRLTAGAVGLGPAPPAIAAPREGPWPEQGLPSPPPRTWGSPTLQRIPQKTPSSPDRPVLLLLSVGDLQWELRRGCLPSSPLPSACCGAGRRDRGRAVTRGGCDAVWAMTTQSFYSWVWAYFNL